MSLAPFIREAICRLDVFGLAALIAPAKQDDHRLDLCFDPNISSSLISAAGEVGRSACHCDACQQRGGLANLFGA
jgi:hypothetical protein